MQENLNESKNINEEIIADENEVYKLRNAILGFIISIFVIGLCIFLMSPAILLHN